MVAMPGPFDCNCCAEAPVADLPKLQVESVTAQPEDAHISQADDNSVHLVVEGSGSRDAPAVRAHTVASGLSPCHEREEKEDQADRIDHAGSIHDSTPRTTQENRLLSMDHLSIDAEMMRGVDLRKTLQAAGRMWRKSPCDMQRKELEGLWAKSDKVLRFDMFLSHTWWTPGRWKFISLLVDSSFGVAASFLLLSMLLILMLYLLRLLPMPWTYSTDAGGEEITVKVGPWLLVCCPWAGIFGLCLGPYLPHVCSSPVRCFLDVASINQVDEELKTRGVYGLGGFLRQSKEMRVLWSEPYFSRLWCVFELAAYKAANPDGKISFRPLYVERMASYLYLGGVVMAFSMLSLSLIKEVQSMRTTAQGFIALVCPLLLIPILRN